MSELYQRSGSPYWYCYITDPREPEGFRRRSTKCVSKREARKAQAALQAQTDAEIAAELDQLERANPAGLKFHDAAEDFILRSGLKASTASDYTSMLTVILSSCLGDFTMANLTHENLRAFIRERRQTVVVPHNRKNSTPAKRETYVSDDRIRRNLSFMSSVYRWSIQQALEGAPEVNIIKTFDRRMLKQSPITDKHLQLKEFMEVVESCESPTHKAMLILLVTTGLRTGELLDLKWGNIDFQNKVIVIGRSEDAATKTNNARRVAMLEDAERTLRAHFSAQKRALAAQKDETSDTQIDPTDLVFPSPVTGERRYDLSYLRNLIKGRTGRKSFTIHALRATYASWLRQKGVDAFTVRDSLGHRTLSTTTRYSHMLPDQVIEEIRQAGITVTAQNDTQSVGFSDTSLKDK